MEMDEKGRLLLKLSFDNYIMNVGFEKIFKSKKILLMKSSFFEN